MKGLSALLIVSILVCCVAGFAHMEVWAARAELPIVFETRIDEPSGLLLRYKVFFGPLVFVAGIYYLCQAFAQSRRIGSDAAFLYLLAGIFGIIVGAFTSSLAFLGY